MRLTVATLNVGAAPAERVLANLAGIDVLALQEMGDRYDIVAALQAAGWRILKTKGRPGQDSTPIAYRVGAVVPIRSRSRLLARAQYVGPGAGPSVLKDKWRIGGPFKPVGGGPRVHVWCVHFPASQQYARRRKVAASMATRLADMATLRRRVILMGDFNTEADARQLTPLRNRMRHTATPATHGRRSIDLIWHRSPSRRPFRLVAEGTRDVGSDHRLHYATLETRSTR